MDQESGKHDLWLYYTFILSYKMAMKSQNSKNARIFPYTHNLICDTMLSYDVAFMLTLYINIYIGIRKTAL